MSVLVFGASSGIGYRTVQRFRKEGHTVHGYARRVEMIPEITDEKRGDTNVRLDVLDIARVKKCLELVRGYWDIAVVSVGSIPDAVAPTSWSDNEVCDYVGVNAGAVLSLIKNLIDDDVSGHQVRTIAVISSIAADTPFPNEAVYCATRAAVAQFCAALQNGLRLLPYGGRNARVTVIKAGLTNTDAARQKFDAVTSHFWEYQALQPDDIVDVIQFVAECPDTCWVDEITIQGSGTID